MTSRFLSLVILAASLCSGGVIADVRAAIGRNEFALAESHIQSYRAAHGVTPEMLEALSWLGRGALAAKKYEQAEIYAEETHQLSLAELKKRPLDQERYLPIALGAAIEVQAHVLAARGRRSEAISFLHGELKTYWNTSIRMRIQKNIHLLSLEGKPAPAIEGVALEKLKGRPVLLFFWAHWCGDCKFQGPILARLKSDFPALKIVAPTQRYGYVARGEKAPPEIEEKYIEQIRRQFYSDIVDAPAPISEENFNNYGASTTPTLVLVNGQGIVCLYHPGRMTYEEMRPLVAAVFGT